MNGYFSINDIRPGDYNLYAWVPGFIGDYRYDDVITITPGIVSSRKRLDSFIVRIYYLPFNGLCGVKTGSDIDVGSLVYEPPRNGPTLWEIGIPDRSAAEFYVPDPNPKYINRLYVNHPDKLVFSLYP